MICILLIGFVCAVGAVTNYDFNEQPESIIYAEDNRIRGFIDHRNKDFVLGGLFGVHRSPGISPDVIMRIVFMTC